MQQLNPSLEAFAEMLSADRALSLLMCIWELIHMLLMKAMAGGKSLAAPFSQSE